MKQFTTKSTKKSALRLALSVFLVLYLVIFAFLFTQKGIHLDGHFYKKSANLTEISYRAASIGADFDRITLQKFIDKSLITIDDKHTVSVAFTDGSDAVVNADSALADVQADWVSIASQDAEKMRGFGSKSWLGAAAVYILFFLSRHYCTEIYTFFHPGKAAGENYYQVFDTAFVIMCITALIYFILPF